MLAYDDVLQEDIQLKSEGEMRIKKDKLFQAEVLMIFDNKMTYFMLVLEHGKY